MDNDLRAYRQHVVKAEQQSIEAYDKGLLTLSGGALGVSFAFIRDIIGSDAMEYKELLVVAWSCWIGAIAATLVSFYCSHRALRKTIDQIDAETVYEERAGGKWSRVTNWLNAASGFLFLSGLVFIVIFVSLNMS